MDRPSSHSQKVPYARKEGRKSLFSKMKDSMRDMLSPSWLSDLVHNVKKDSPDTTDKNTPTSSEQVTIMHQGPHGIPNMDPSQQLPTLPSGPVSMTTTSDPQQQGLSRDPSFRSRGSFLGNGQPRTLEFSELGQGVTPGAPLASPYQQGNFPPPISEFTSAQLPLARLTEKSDSIMAQEDTLSQRSDGSKSTSGCSSMVPQADVSRQDTGGDKRKAPEQGASGGISPQDQQAAKRQRLLVGASSSQPFSRRLNDTFLNKSSAAEGHRPAFNTTLFGSPLADESSLLGTSLNESSFYPGKTKFGGRSSLSFRSRRKTVDLNQSLPGRLSVPVKAFMKAKPRLNPNKEAVTSSTAKRILEALDRMPTPLNDAKKIPMVPRDWTESPSFFARDRSSRSGPPTQKLNVSSQISISKNRQVSFAPVGQPKPSTSQVSEATVSKPTRQDTVILNNEMAGSGKMRREKSYHRGSASVKTTLEEEDTVVIPDLQTDFTLPVSSMPKFSFMAPVPQPKAVEPVSQSEKRTDSQTITQGQVPKPKSVEPVSSSGLAQSTVSTESQVKQSMKFTFSSPIIEPVPSNKPASPQKYGAFQFSSPISVDKKTEISVGIADSEKPFIATPVNKVASTPGFSFSAPANNMNIEYSFSTAPKPKPKINGPVEPAGGGFQAASELKQGSVMDILGGGGFKKSTVEPAGGGFQAVSELKQGSVMDILGGGGFKKSTTPSTQSDNSSTGIGGTEASKPPALSTLFKQSGWSCDVCLINNKDNVDKCVACQTPKPGGQTSKEVPKTAASEPLKTDLLAKFQQASGTWTCDVCLLQNKPDISKCVACQTQKPGASSTSSSPLTSSIQPGNWICSKCLIQNKQADTVCGACKTAKSSSKPSELNKSDSLFSKLKPAAGSWECEVCLVQNKQDANTCVACQTAKPLKFFKHPPGDWTCDTCLVSNKETAVNCIACNYARPGPPRTQAVPSIAKSYTSSQASGFGIPNMSDSGGESKINAGGFKFTAPSSAGGAPSGFDVAKINENAQKVSDSKPVTGGFKFNAGSSSETAAESGFKFGVQASSGTEKAGVSSGGFKFDTDKQATGLKVGSSDSKSEKIDNPLKSAGFQFGKSDSSLGSVSSSASNSTTASFSFGQKVSSTSAGGLAFGQKTESSGSAGGFAFGQKTESSALKDLTQTTTSVPGGFTLKPSDSLDSAKSSEPVTNTSQSLGGFNFTTVTTTSNSATVTANNSIGTFQFTATKVTDASILTGTTKAVELPASTVGGGFSFSQQSVESNTSNQPFSFAQKTAPSTSPTKRGREEDAGEPALKKAPFSVGQTAASTSSSLFQFGANNASAPSSGSSSVFAFGQKPSTTSTTELFAFGKQNSAPAGGTGLSVFGIQNSAPASNTAPSIFGQKTAPVTTTSSVSSAFVFGGQKTTESNVSTLPVFGQTKPVATTTVASTPSLFQFCQTNKTASTAPAFNFSTQSSGQPSVFGSSAPSFNFTAQKTETSAGSSAPGLFKFGASQPAPATTPAFGSASAFGSSSTPAFGTGSGATGAFSGNAPSTIPAFGSTPPAFGSSNSNTGQAAPAFGGVFGNQPAAPAQSSALFQFGAKPAESSQPTPSVGFNFSASSNPAGLGVSTNFNFSAQGSGVNTFSATGTPTEGRKIKKAARRIKR